MNARRTIPILLVSLLATALAACSREPAPAPRSSDPAVEPDREAPAGADPAPAGGATATKREPRPIDAATAGVVRGVVRFEGPPPARKEMAIGSTAGCEHHPVPPLTEDVIVADGLVANVFVHVRAGLEGWIVPPPPAEPVLLDQHGCMYRPRVVGMRAGQKLSVKNSDPATHNVHARPDRNDGFNRTQAPGGAPVEWTPEKAEVMVPFGCDIHPWMKAWVGVRDHPFFAVTGADGRFEIAGLPPGEYTLEAWHEKLGKKTGKVTLSASGSAEISFAFAAR